MAITRLKPLLSHTVFRWASGISALVALSLGVLGSLMDNVFELRSVHAVLALVFLVTSLVSALSGMRYAKQSNTSGIIPLGFAVFIIGAIQYGLGELYITWPHMILGLVVILGAGALFVKARQQPSVVTAQGDPGASDPR
ncbi:MAG: hypothetical protein Q4F65_05065 [Propionibacteriaceae bacterium]|nr:hypothetical protein [Propionibacteriaceae bacterium]